MTRGTTPTNTFTTSIDLDGATIFLTYSQGGNVVFEKTGDDLTLTSTTEEGVTTHTITTTLTQEDTLALNTDMHVRVQIRAIFANGIAVASDIAELKVGEILKDGEIEYEGL